MKKVIVSFLIIIMFLTNSAQYVWAAHTKGTDGSGSGSASESKEQEEESWVKKAFSAASSFMNDSEVNDDLGVVKPVFERFKSIVKSINAILMVLLMGLSIIALSVTGVRYIASGAAPHQKETAKQSLHTIFIGMAIGFGAYVIWRIAMSIVEIMIDALA